jgi:hypothetical protein
MKDLGKKFNLIVGVLFTLISALLFAASAKMYLEPVQNTDIARIKKNAISSCSANFNGSATYLGLETEVKGEDVYFTAYGIDQWEGKINMASHIVSSCGGMSLKQFCFGESCDISKMTGDEARLKQHTGMFMVLSYEDTNIDPRVDRSRLTE